MMIRRGTGRTPPFILVGLVILVLILGFNYWTLSSQNADLQQEIEKIQAEVKISAVKQEQSDKKNAALGETVHEMEELSSKLKQKLKEEDDALLKSDQSNQKKDYEITSLKNQVVKFQEQIASLTQQLEERDVEVSKAKETNMHLASERDDAVEAIAEKDTLINNLKRQLEQAQKEVAAVRREKMAVAKPEIVPGAMNIPGINKKDPFLGPGQLAYVQKGAVQTHDKGMDGFTLHRGVPILPRDPPNAPRKQPRFSVADIAKEMNRAENEQDMGVLANPQAIEPHHLPNNENNMQDGGPAVMDRPVNNVPIQAPEHNADNGHNDLVRNNNGPGVMERPNPPVVNIPIQAPEHPQDGEAQPAVNDVLAPPPQHLDGLEADSVNLLDPVREKEDDAEKRNKAEEDLNDDNKQDNLDAAIDEEEKIVEDLMDDQDEEGNDVKQNEEALDEDKALEDMREHPRVGNIVGGLKIPPKGVHGDEFNHQDMNVEEDIGNQGNYYENNIDNNNIRNLQRPPDFQ